MVRLGQVRHQGFVMTLQADWAGKRRDAVMSDLNVMEA